MHMKSHDTDNDYNKKDISRARLYKMLHNSLSFRFLYRNMYLAKL